MTLIMTHMILSILISLVLILAATLLGSRMTPSRNKNTPFECGFDPKESARMPFSLRFFLLAVVFLIFDIEIAMLFPLILGLSITKVMMTYLSGLIFLIILMLGLIHEWKEGSLSWVL